MPSDNRKTILIASLALILISAGFLFMATRPTGPQPLLKAPPVAEEKPTATPQAAAEATPTPAPAAMIHGDYFLLTQTQVIEITRDQKTVRTFSFAAQSAQRLSSGNTLFAAENRVFEADPQGKVTWQFKDEPLNATSAWRRPDGMTLVSDANGRVLEISPDGEILKQVTLPAGAHPSSVYPLGGDDVLVADPGLHQVSWIEMSNKGFVIWQYGMPGQKGFSFNQLNTPVFAADDDGQGVVIADSGNNRLAQIDYGTKQPVWIIDHVPNPHSAVMTQGRVRLTTSDRGVEAIYQNRTFDWSYQAQPVYRAFPVKNLPKTFDQPAGGIQASPSGITGWVAAAKLGILGFFKPH